MAAGRECSAILPQHDPAPETGARHHQAVLHADAQAATRAFRRKMVGQAKQANEQETCGYDKTDPVFRQPGPTEQASARTEHHEGREQQQVQTS